MVSDEASPGVRPGSFSEITTVTPSTWNVQQTTGNPSAQSFTASGGTLPLIVFGMVHADPSGGNASFSTENPALTATVLQSASNDEQRAGYKIYNSSDHSFDEDDEDGWNYLASGYLEVHEARAAASCACCCGLSSLMIPRFSMR